MAIKWFLAVALLSLAGCTSSVQTNPSESSSAQMMTTSASSAPVPSTTTDMLHFMQSPHLSTVSPHAAAALHVPIAAPFAVGSPNQNAGGSWNFTWDHAEGGVIRGNITLIIDVEGTILGNPQTLSPNNGTAEFLGIALSLAPPDMVGVTDSRLRTFFASTWEPLQVPNGLQKLNIPFSIPATSLNAGWSVQFTITSDATFIGPGSTLEMLTASTSYDSSLQFHGLNLPIGLDNVALLQTT